MNASGALGNLHAFECRFAVDFDPIVMETPFVYVFCLFVSQMFPVFANSPVRNTARKIPAEIKTFFILASQLTESR